MVVSYWNWKQLFACLLVVFWLVVCGCFYFFVIRQYGGTCPSVLPMGVATVAFMYNEESMHRFWWILVRLQPATIAFLVVLHKYPSIFVITNLFFLVNSFNREGYEINKFDIMLWLNKLVQNNNIPQLHFFNNSFNNVWLMIQNCFLFYFVKIIQVKPQEYPQAMPGMFPNMFPFGNAQVIVKNYIFLCNICFSSLKLDFFKLLTESAGVYFKFYFIV